MAVGGTSSLPEGQLTTSAALILKIMETISIKWLGDTIKVKAFKVRRTKKPEMVLKYHKLFCQEFLTDLLWSNGKDVMIEMLDPNDLETKHIFKIDFKAKK